MKKNCTPFLLGAFLLTFSLAASAQNTYIKLDGSNYVSMGSDVVPTGGSFTVEFWAYIPSYASGQHQFISQGAAGAGFYIGYDGDDPTHQIQAGDLWQTTGVTMPEKQWVHIALTFDGTNATLYLNGIQAATTSFYLISGGSNPFQIGVQYDNVSGFLTGGMDELRIWNTVRTAAQIRNGMYGAVNPATMDLLEYYTMNDVTSSDQVKSTANGPDAVSGADGTWTTQNPAFWATSPIETNANSLTFAESAGIFPQVNIPGNTVYDLVSGGTLELWVYPTSLTASKSTLISNQGGGNTRYIFQVSDSKIYLDNGTNTVSVDYTLPLNIWTHLAFVYNGGSATAVYVNNSAVSPGTLSLAYGSASSQGLTLGLNNNADPFQGAIDEVRIWSTMLDQPTIAANIYTDLTGSESGLEGMFSFNQGIADGDNQYLITAPDNSIHENDATLQNFVLTAASVSNFSSNIPVILPVNFTSFTATAQKDQALLQWQTAQEQNSRDFVVERSVDGAAYSAIGSVDAAGSSHAPLNYSFVDPAPVNGKNYYRLKETDLDNKFMYSEVRVLDFSAPDDGRKLVWFQTGEKAVEVDLKAGSNEAYTVTDMGGRMIQQGQLSSGKLYLSQLSGGLYFVKVITATGKQLDTKVVVK